MHSRIKLEYKIRVFVRFEINSVNVRHR